MDNNGTDWDPNDGVDVTGQVYGSPYDIMSAEAFGKRWLGGTTWRSNPVFAGPAVPGWPSASEASMGPHLSRAYLHLRWPDAFGPARVVDRPFPATNGQIDATVRAPSATDPGTVLVLHPPGEPASGVGRVYVEYRPFGGWDAGLDILGMDLGRTGVVVHSVVDAGGGDGITVWYRGSVPEVSFDIDVDLPGVGLVLTAQRMGDGTADVTVRRVATQALRIVKTNASDDIMHERVERTETTPCGDQVRYGTWITSSFCQFRVTGTGHGGTGAPLVSAPTVSWTVAGVPVSGTSGTVEIPFEGVSFTAEYTIDPVVFELALTSRGGERYTAQVVATVDGTSTWASADFESIGWREGMHPDDSHLLVACLVKIVRRQRIPPRRFVRPDPGPRFDPKIITGVPLDRFPLWHDRVTEQLSEIAGLSESDAAALERLIELQRPSG